MIGFANERIANGLPLPGVIVARDSLPVGQVIEDLLLILEAGQPGDYEGIVTFLPF